MQTLGRPTVLPRAWLAGCGSASLRRALPCAAPRRAALAVTAARKSARLPPPQRRGSRGNTPAKPGSAGVRSLPKAERPLELKPPRTDATRVAILRGAAALGFVALAAEKAQAAVPPAETTNVVAGVLLAFAAVSGALSSGRVPRGTVTIKGTPALARVPRRGGASARPSAAEARALRDAAYAVEGDSSAGSGVLAGASALFLAAAAAVVTLPVGELGTQAVRWPSAAAPVYQPQRYEVARPQPIRHLPARAAVYAAASRTAPHPMAAPKRLAARTQSVAAVRRNMAPPPVVFAPPPPPPVAVPVVAVAPMPAAEVVRTAFPFSPDAPYVPCAPAMAGYAVAAAVMVAGIRGGAADAASAPAMAVSAEALSVAAAAWATAAEAAAPAAEAGGAGARGNALRAAPAAAGEAPQTQAAPAAEGAAPTAGKPRRKAPRSAPGSPGKAPRA